MKREYDVKPLLAELEALIPSVDWQRDRLSEDLMADRQVRCFIGYASTWRFVVASFAIPDRNGRGVDGTAMSMQRSLVIRLTPELAQKFGNAAEEATRDVDQG
jgi:hypothetical protein